MEIIARRGTIDHIEVSDTEFNRVDKNGNTITVKGKMYAFYVKTGSVFCSGDPIPMFRFEGRNESFIEPFKNLKTELIQGRDVITAATIRAAECPEELKPYMTADGKFIGDDGTEYISYGEYLLTLGTKNAAHPKDGTRAIATANLPISDGLMSYVRLDRNGKPRKRANGQLLIQKTLNVATVLDWDEPKQCWTAGAGGTTPLEQLRAEINNQLENNQLKLFDIPKENDDEDEDNNDVASTKVEQD